MYTQYTTITGIYMLDSTESFIASKSNCPPEIVQVGCHRTNGADTLILLIVGAFIYYSAIVSPYFLKGAFSNLSQDGLPSFDEAKKVVMGAWGYVGGHNTE